MFAYWTKSGVTEEDKLVSNYQLNAVELAEFFTGGYAFLAANKLEINALNVFPVPDGDTGTNMGLTMASAVKGIAGKNTVADVASAVANGALMGARGNSGVILSQIFRGFAQGLTGKEVLNANDMAHALQKGTDLAYRSVMRPAEGTILTVCKHMALAAKAYANDKVSIIDLLEHIIAQGQIALDNTPNQLPALKQAGVVDAGGKGLLCIFEGGLKILLGEKIELDTTEAVSIKNIAATQDTSDLIYHYCTEFFIHGKNIPLELIREYFASKGDSLVAVGMDEVVKIHVHTDNPGHILDYALRYGSLHDIKIDNMKDQHRESVEVEKALNGNDNAPAEMPQELAECGVVAVASGEGLNQIFKELGVGAVISGGQSMNPSAEDIVNAINKVSAKAIIVLPNNSNIILAAAQAKELVEKPVYVVPTKYITQGLAAMMAYNPEETVELNAKEMEAAIKEVASAQITYAVRDSQFDGGEIHEGDILGLVEGKITVSSKTKAEAVQDVLSKMVKEKDSLITLFYGEDIQEKEAHTMAEEVSEHYPDLEVEVQPGGQAVYYYLISVE